MVGRELGLRADSGEPGKYAAVAANTGRQACRTANEYELLGRGDVGQRRQDDHDVELPGGAGSAGAIECGTAVSVSGRWEGSEAGCSESAECAECNCAGCTAGSEEPGTAVSVSGRAASGIVFEFVWIVAEFGGCEAGSAGRVERCGELGVQQFKQLEFGFGLFEFQGR
jgi:hypothetical protein